MLALVAQPEQRASTFTRLLNMIEQRSNLLGEISRRAPYIKCRSVRIRRRTQVYFLQWMYRKYGKNKL